MRNLFLFLLVVLPCFSSYALKEPEKNTRSYRTDRLEFQPIIPDLHSEDIYQMWLCENVIKYWESGTKAGSLDEVSTRLELQYKAWLEGRLSWRAVYTRPNTFTDLQKETHKIMESPELVGFVAATYDESTQTVVLSYCLNTKFHGMGLATESLRAFFAADILRIEDPVRYIYTTVHPENFPSIKLSKKFNFKDITEAGFHHHHDCTGRISCECISMGCNRLCTKYSACVYQENIYGLPRKQFRMPWSDAKGVGLIAVTWPEE